MTLAPSANTATIAAHDDAVSPKAAHAAIASHGTRAPPTNQPETLHTTTEHPFLTTDRGFVDAVKLRVGEQVRQLGGHVGVVVAVVVTPGAAVRYNLTVRELHTFAVGAGLWVVHNCGNEVTLYRGTTLGDASEVVDNGAINAERIQYFQRNVTPTRGAGAYFSSQLSTAAEYANTAGAAGRGLGPAVLVARIPRNLWAQFTSDFPIPHNLPIVNKAGQLETVIPFGAAMERFNQIANFSIIQ